MIARIGIRLLSWLLLAYMVLPLAVILGASFTATSYLAFPPQGWTLQWYRQFLGDPSYLSAFFTSAMLACAATAVAIALAIPSALAVARYDFPGKGAISALLMSPLVLPHVVLGAALLQFGSSIGLTRSFTALLVGHTVIVLPFVMRSVLAMLTPEQRALEEASADLGAGPLQTFFLVLLPQIRPGLVTGAIFAFISSFINVELSIFNTTADLNTIPVKLFNYVQYTIDPTIAAVSGATIVAAFLAIVILDLTVGLDMLSEPR
ncbi:polyamine ABC transporter permease [Bordetella genomosp. 9]|uniref:Polyamine ABC transporter permease n=1 Tax=Bordetella genomosp. 9 TaxID=1416803 RepID=A0A261R2L6_9BORD|nr:ABC transporter permease [Bordetella genomosp. 9]OZI18967.1 polyamine ABC transporter permease [Bordetella genomosp. 9]